MKITSQRFRMEGNPCNLYKLLSSCQDSQSSDPKDKIYALIPLAENITKDGIPIDYSITLFGLKLKVVLHYFAHKNQPVWGVWRVCRLVEMVCSRGDEEQLSAIEPILRTRNNKFAGTRKGFEV
jgi:hypothetical protein